jgi:hypothetical protein
MLEPLDSKDDSEGQNRGDARPEAEVAEPDTGIAEDLRNGLKEEVGNDGGGKGLSGRETLARF